MTTICEMKKALEEITNINSQLLRNKLKPQDDLLVLKSQEIALKALAD